MKLSIVHKICLTGLLLALTIVCTRLLSIQNIPIIPFVRISFGPALIIFSSLLLGPLCGAVVGAGSDILGIVLFPNSLGYGINPFFTIVYGLLGILPWLIYYFVKNIKNKKITAISLFSCMFALWIFLLIFMISHDQIYVMGRNYVFELWQKWLIIVLSFVLIVATGVAIYFTNKLMERKFGDNEIKTYSISFCSLVCEIIVMLILDSIIKTIFFEVDFLFVFFAQAVVFFIDVPLNTFIATYLLLLSKRLFRRRV